MQIRTFTQIKHIIQKSSYRYDMLPQEQYFINQRDANLSRYPIYKHLKPLPGANQGHGSGSSDEVVVVGVPLGNIKGELDNYDTWQRLATVTHPDLIFLQLDPCAYIARQRFLAHKCALDGVEDYDIRDTRQIDPHKPHAWEECVVNGVVLDMVDRNQNVDQVDLTAGVSTYAYPEVHNNAIREQTKDRFINIISEHIINRKFSPYYLINKILYTALLNKHKVLLGDMPEHLLRMQLGNTLELQELRDIFKYVLKQVGSMKFPTSFRKSTLDLLPHVFQAPRDLYMTAMLKEAFQNAESLTAFVGLHHYNPIVNYWQPPPHGINFTDASRVPPRIRGETDEQLIEKQAILDVMLESTTWAERYLSNPFPYLAEDITKQLPKVKKTDMEGMKKCFFDNYQKYSAFKIQAQKELPHFKSDKDIKTLSNLETLLALPEHQDSINIKAYKKQQESQNTNFKLQKLKK